MEYVQMTLTDWLDTKRKLQEELLGIRRSFVKIGYYLRKADVSKAYEQDGYKTVVEWAKGEYGLEASTVSRFMAINREFSIEGFSEHLMPEYEEFKRSQLEEMLRIEKSDRAMIEPEASREAIRDFKKFTKQEAVEEDSADDVTKLVRSFCEENKELVNELYASKAVQTANDRKVSEIVNPSGNRSYRKGIFFMMFYRESIKIKKFGGAIIELAWKEFVDKVIAIFGMEYEPEQEKEENEEEPEFVTKRMNLPVRDGKIVNETVIAPAQETAEILEKNEVEEAVEQQEQEEKITEIVIEEEKITDFVTEKEKRQSNVALQNARTAFKNLKIAMEAKAYKAALADARNLVHYLERMEE